jgi:hypothetical protein
MKKKHFYTPCVGLSVYMRSSQYREVTPVGLCRRGRWWQGSGTQNSAVVGSAVLIREKKLIER